MNTHWLTKEVSEHPANDFLTEVIRAVEENLAAHLAAVEAHDGNAIALIQEATLGFVREKLEESWLRGMEYGQGRAL
jgi:hypothetical protein